MKSKRDLRRFIAFTGVCRCLAMFTGVCPRLPVFARVCPRFPLIEGEVSPKLGLHTALRKGCPLP